MRGVAHQEGPRRQRRRGWLGIAVGCLVVGSAIGLALVQARGGPTPYEPSTWSPLAAVDESAIPDDTVLLEQLDKAIDLRRREDFDRMLDARDPGELVEHATLTEAAFEHRDARHRHALHRRRRAVRLPVPPGERLGQRAAPIARRSTTRRACAASTTGAAGGPDAFGCFSCHSKGGPDGAGTQTQNAFLRGDGERIGSADQRNPPHLLGLGPIALLAREMSAELQAAGGGARASARRRKDAASSRRSTTQGRLVRPHRRRARRHARLRAAVEGVDADLTVRPFGWKGHQATLRDMAEESLHIHQGLLSTRIQLAVRDGTLDAGPYGKGARGTTSTRTASSLEIDSGMLTTVVGYLAQLEAPVMRPPRDPGLARRLRRRPRRTSTTIGCAGCHVPTLELDDPKLDARQPATPDRAAVRHRRRQGRRRSEDRAQVRRRRRRPTSCTSSAT